ncbi:MAG TPA: FGGY family carbohydrate kinase [Saprospiraceae bacterium]|nr:FGGY family carbohydrate kinase [Saprospiraceae bacterium]
MLSLGIDVGSSSVKVSIFDIVNGKVLAHAQYPETEMEMIALQPGWAEQDPEWWWIAFLHAYSTAISKQDIDTLRIECIGIAYQMHGLVCMDKNGSVLRPSIIWCDSRAVQIGNDALAHLGVDYCFNHLLNSPGNFTLSKLKWVKDNEPDIYNKIHKICLPGDYLAYKLSGTLTTTIGGLSEGVMYDFTLKNLSYPLLDYFGIDPTVIPVIHKNFDDHGKISPKWAKELKVSPNAIITYKAGDQPNNALSLNVLKQGEVAATAGTSGVVYGVAQSLFIDYSQRVNSFAHVNYTKDSPSLGILLCINGVGIANSWIKKITNANNYFSMNHSASTILPGASNLYFYPFGNGTERMLQNKNTNAWFSGIEFNNHTNSHLYRAVQEGIAYSFKFGMESFIENDIHIGVIRAGHANLFLSDVFSQVLSSLLKVKIELYNTDGSIGAARGALIGNKITDFPNAFQDLHKIKTIEPDLALTERYEELYNQWRKGLINKLTETN